jgi:hypothetical protein
MTSKINKVKDWIDDILEEDEQCTMWQIGFIEQLMITSSSNCSYTNISLNDLTYNEAQDIIDDLYENNNPTDTRQQYEKMRRAGVFK